MNSTEHDTSALSCLKEIGLITKTARLNMSMSRADFARSLGLSERTVFHFEEGQPTNMNTFLLILSFFAIRERLPEWLEDCILNKDEENEHSV